MSVYCLACRAGRESAVEEYLAGEGYGVLHARLLTHGIRPHGVYVPEEMPAFPGYVFFERAAEPDWKTIAKNDDIFEPVRYSNGDTALQGPDLKLIDLLKLYKGYLGLSRVRLVGTRVVPVDGPLKTCEHSIVRVNRRRHSAEVRLSEEGLLMKSIWLVYEVVE